MLRSKDGDATCKTWTMGHQLVDTFLFLSIQHSQWTHISEKIYLFNFAFIVPYFVFSLEEECVWMGTTIVMLLILCGCSWLLLSVTKHNFFVI